MPRGDKSSYSGKQKRQAEHIEQGYRKRGVSKDEAEERAWRTVNKQTGGAKKKSGGARKKKGSAGGRKSSGRKKGTARKSSRSTRSRARR